VSWGTRSLAPLAERNFRLFFFGASWSLLGDAMAVIALTFAVLDLTGSAEDLGYVLAARSIPLIAMVVFAGVVADRQPRRRVMLSADVARLISQGALAALLISGHALVWELMALSAVHGAASSLFYPASTGLIPQVVSEGALQQANALRGLAQSVGNIIGPALGGVMVAAAGAGWAIAFDAATFGISAVSLAMLRVAPQPLSSETTHFFRELREGWREFIARRWVWVTVVGMSLTNMMFAVLLVLGPVMAKRGMGGAPAWAAILSAYGAGSLVGGMTALRFQPRRPMLAAALAATVCPWPAIALAVRTPVAVVCALALLAGWGLTVFNVLWETTLQRSVPQETLSRVSSYDWFGSSACQPIGQAASGPLAAVAGVGGGLGLTGVVQIGISIALLAVPDLRRLRLRSPVEPERPATPVGPPES
jgi:predicted MFS family arabinose efflux permease